MAHSELHGTIRHHHKTSRLMRVLKINRREAVGIMAMLYSWAIENRPGGIIEAALIPDAVEWDRDEDIFQILLDAKLLDDVPGMTERTVKIHNWPKYTRNYLKAQSDAKERREKLLKERAEEGDQGPAPARTRKPKPVQPPAKDEAAPESTTPGPEAESGEPYVPAEAVRSDDEMPPGADRSSSPAALCADMYMRANPDLVPRAKVIACFSAAIANYGCDPKMLEIAVHNEAACKGILPWDITRPLSTSQPAVRETQEDRIRKAGELLEARKAELAAKKARVAK